MFLKNKDIQIDEEQIQLKVANNPLSQFIGFRFKKNGKILFKFNKEKRRTIDMWFVPTDLYLYFYNQSGDLICSDRISKSRLLPMKPSFEFTYLLESSEKMDPDTISKIEPHQL